MFFHFRQPISAEKAFGISGPNALTIGLMSSQIANQKMSSHAQDFQVVEGQQIQLLNCLRDIKFIIIRFLAMRTVLDHYYCRGFDWLKEKAIDQCLKSRGLERETFDDLVELFEDWESEHITQMQSSIDTDLRAIYDDFKCSQIDSLKEAVEPLLPKESSGPGEFPLIEPNVIISLVELAYNVQLAYANEWNVDDKIIRRDCQIFRDCLKSSTLKVENIEKYDAMNLLHVNIARAILADPEDTVLHLTWIRIQYILGV